VIPLARLLLTAGVCGVLALTAASPALASAECTNTYTGQPIANCTTLAGPWVAVPARVGEPPSIAWWGDNCPANGRVVGADWRPDANRYALTVYVNLFPGKPVYAQGTVGLVFGGASAGIGASFQPLIGCLGGASASAVGQGRSPQRRIVTHRVRPGRTRTYSHACTSAGRLVGGGAGVGFFERRPPTARELRQLDVRHTLRRGRVRVRVRTGKVVGDDERVRLQIHAVCRP
jgi:hypothetical protein